MEMERINENLIKVLIGVEDLEERGINFLDLIGDQSSIEQFFYSILEEVDVDQHFHESEAVTFQVMPSSEGLELYISRTNLDEMDEFFEDEITKRIRERKKNKNQKQDQESDNKEASDEDETPAKAHESILNIFNPEFAAQGMEEMDGEVIYDDEVLVFNELDDFIKMARELPTDKIIANLYHMTERYFLVITDIDQSIKEEAAYNKILAMLEYGETHPTTEAVLAEHGTLIRETDALHFFGTKF